MKGWARKALRGSTAVTIPDLGGMVRLKGTGYQIRDHLAEVGSDFEMNTWRAVKAECQEAGVGYPSYESFRNYFNRLKKLKLVLPAKRGFAPSTAGEGQGGAGGRLLERKYYALNPSRIDDSAWRNPQPAYLEYLRTRRE